MKTKHPIALTIAGSDSGGGAGIQADLKTFQRLHVFGTSAITCLTAQNPDIVRKIIPVDPDMVALQITTVLEAFRVSAAKTGMLYSAQIIHSVADAIEASNIPFVIVDPVMVATSGARLLRNDAINALCSRLPRMAHAITPNIAEAEVLRGKPIKTIKDIISAAREIGEKFHIACIVKGGHLPGDRAVDALFDPTRPAKNRESLYSIQKLKGIKTHGTGCMFSAALTAYLARGADISTAARQSKRFVYRTLQG